MAWTESYHCDVCNSPRGDAEDWWLAWTDHHHASRGRGTGVAAHHALEPFALPQRRREASVRCAMRPDVHGSLDAVGRREALKRKPCWEIVSPFSLE